MMVEIYQIAKYYRKYLKAKQECYQEGVSVTDNVCRPGQWQYREHYVERLQVLS